MLPRALFIFVLAFIFAGLEVEVEGKYGWSEKIPTWYRCNKFYGWLMAGKPLTGYHSYMFLLPITMFHIPFFLGLSWSLVKELEILAVSWSFSPLWDFLWFVINPYYGVDNFKPGKIWWHKQWLGQLPKDYYWGWGLSILFAVLSGAVSFFGGSDFTTVVFNQCALLIWLIGLTMIVAFFLAPSYHRWYFRMREVDERGKAGIYHSD